MFRFHYIFNSFITLSIILVSMSFYACGTKNAYLSVKVISGKVLIKNQSFNKNKECQGENCKSNCCNKGTRKHSSKDCSGKCGGHGCISSHSFSGFACLNNFLRVNFEIILPLQKSSFFYQNPVYSFGFHKIWQPPKIG